MQKKKILHIIIIIIIVIGRLLNSHQTVISSFLCIVCM